MRQKRFYIQDCGINVPIGSKKWQVADALKSYTQSSLVKREDLVSGQGVYVGTIKTDLPPLPEKLKKLDCRNNRLMQTCLEEISPSVERAKSKYDPSKIAVILGTSTSGISEGEYALMIKNKTGQWPDDFDYKQQEISGLSRFAADYFGLTGPAYTIATACSSSTKVFASAKRLISLGIADAVIVGGADTLCRMTLNGFNSLELLSKDKCKPFSVNRDGINIGEGASAFLISCEEAEVELMGTGEASDAYHQTSPDPEGKGAQESMLQALREAQLTPDDIAYINLHGTATKLNDAMEAKAVSQVFSEGTLCSSTKSSTGHMLGAAGGCEAAFLWLLLNPETSSGILPPHIWDNEYDETIPKLNFVTEGQRFHLQNKTAMLSNSFGFGGSNASLIMGRR